MAAPSANSTIQSLSKMYEGCVRSFEDFLRALNEENCHVISSEQINILDALEEFGRVKIWGNQAGVNIPAEARGSLDDMLWNEDELKRLTRQILKRLTSLLDEATSVAQMQDESSDQISVSSDSATSCSNSNCNCQPPHSKMSKTGLLFQQIKGRIRALYDICALIRRPKLTNKYIRSVSSKSKTAATIGKDTLPLGLGFSCLDESHITEKVRQWRGLTKSGRGVRLEDEHDIPLLERSTTGGTEDISWFCHRLATANTRRREQLWYWTKHPYNSKPETTQAERPGTADLKKAPTEPGIQGRGSQASMSKSAVRHMPSYAEKSATSKQSFSTANLSEIQDPKMDLRPQTEYANTNIGQARSNTVPELPKAAYEDVLFSCPWCGTFLDSREMRNRQSWKHHVFHDLRPYVCTFEDCQNSGKLFSSRHEWIHHELQIHRREYFCTECSAVFSSRDEFAAHLRVHCDEALSESQLKVNLELNNRQVDVTDTKQHPCLICGDQFALLGLQRHLAAHMEDISLFVLPRMNPEEETGSSNASVQVRKAKSIHISTDTESEGSRLGSSAVGIRSRNSRSFAEFLPRQEMGYSSKFSFWRATCEDQESVSTGGIQIIPYPRNPQFVNRHVPLLELEEHLLHDESHARVAITGLGGFGKTQIAIEVAYRATETYPQLSVFWIPSASVESVERTFLGISRRLKIPGIEERQADVKELLRDYLTQNGHWLLIFDNADNVNMWVDGVSGERVTRGLLSYLPHNSTGKILFTTRSTSFAVELAKKTVNITLMREEEASLLLRNHLINQSFLSKHEDAVQLLSKLSHHPLAIVQAAAYINENGLNTSSEYLLLLESQEKEVTDLLGQGSEDYKLDSTLDVESSVVGTWLRSFKQVQNDNPLAAEYICFLASLEPTSVPEFILPPATSAEEWTEAMRMLISFSFVTRRPTEQSLNLHRACYLATQNWLRKQGSLEEWNSKALGRLTEIFPDASPDNRHLWKASLPHAMGVLCRDGSNDMSQRCTLLSKVGRCLLADDRASEAVFCFEEVYKLVQLHHGEEHPDLVLPIHELAEAYKANHQTKKAAELLGHMVSLCADG